jgi:hypothetical protein
MCWNAEVSLNTFIFGVISAIIIYKLNVIPKYVIFILLSFTSIQLLEYFTWTYINNKKINKILSIIGLHIIFLQIFLLNYYAPHRKILLIYIIICYVLFMLLEFKNINFSMKKGKNGHLIWYWLDLHLLWIIIGISCYIFPAISSGKILLFTFVLTTIIISLYYYYKTKTWGSMWCYISNIIWIFFIIKSIYIIALSKI